MIKLTGTQSYMQGVMLSSGFKQMKKNKRTCNR
jgi:hypothetical protein